MSATGYPLTSELELAPFKHFSSHIHEEISFFFQSVYKYLKGCGKAIIPQSWALKYKISHPRLIVPNVQSNHNINLKKFPSPTPSQVKRHPIVKQPYDVTRLLPSSLKLQTDL